MGWTKPLSKVASVRENLQNVCSVTSSDARPVYAIGRRDHHRPQKWEYDCSQETAKILLKIGAGWIPYPSIEFVEKCRLEPSKMTRQVMMN